MGIQFWRAAAACPAYKGRPCAGPGRRPSTSFSELRCSPRLLCWVSQGQGQGAHSTHRTVRTIDATTLRRRAAHIPPCSSGSGADLASIAATMSGDTEARPNPNDARPAFVSPRTLLEQARPILPPRSFTALDREQLDGLVHITSSATLRRAPRLTAAAHHPRLPQGPDQL